jgi:CheY-like chemotaxis protein
MDAALKILAVDNEPSVTLSMRYIFAGPRYELTRADNGMDALARLDADSDRYDVIIVDQKMPHLTGVELVSAIRARGIRAKIIVVSAHVSSEIREAYERMDVRVMFGKPFDVGALRSAVDRLAA